MLRETRALDPKPGTQLHSGPEAIHPDVLIKPSPGGRWQSNSIPKRCLGPDQPNLFCRSLTSRRHGALR
ncbi:hypothetical protein MPLA_670019 [Mesorhizobium sp. ORS 3359]|nr:hypothetical protein MPLA_670019 [Mesorhizobium sp. ORS 3359]